MKEKLKVVSKKKKKSILGLVGTRCQRSLELGCDRAGICWSAGNGNRWCLFGYYSFGVKGTKSGHSSTEISVCLTKTGLEILKQNQISRITSVSGVWGYIQTPPPPPRLRWYPP